MNKKSVFRMLTTLMLAVFFAAGLYAQDVAVFPQGSHFSYMAFSPDWRQNYTINNNTVRLWDRATGRELRTFSGHDKVTSASLSSDGKQLLTGYGDGIIKLWDTATGRELRTFSGHSDPVDTVSFSPDGKQVLSGSWDSSIKLWDTATGREIRTFLVDPKYGRVRSLVFSPDGRQVLSGFWHCAVILWDVATGREIRAFEENSNPSFTLLLPVSFSPDGRQALSGSNFTVTLWDVATGRKLKTFGHSHAVSSVSFSPDGRQVLSSSWDKTVKIWDAATGREIMTFSGHSSFVEDASFSPDGRQVLSSSDGNTKLWDAATGVEIRTFSEGSDNGVVRSVCFSPDGRQILSGNRNTVKLWDASTGREIRTFSGHSDSVKTVSFSPDGRQVLSSSADNTVKLWDLATGREIRTFPGDDKNWVVRSASFSPDGRQMLSAWASDLKLWDVATGREIRTFTVPVVGYADTASFSSDGRQILSSHSSKVILLDVATGREIRTFSGLTADVHSVRFSPDGRQVLAGSGSGSIDSRGYKIKLWDIATGREIMTFSGHSMRVNSVGFSPDGRQILSGSLDGSVKLWDTATGREIRTLTHSSEVHSVSFSPDGKKILSGSGDGTIRLWDAATGKEIAQFISFFGKDSQLASATRGLKTLIETAVTSNEGEWVAITPDGYYQASPRGDRYLNVRVNNTVTGIDSYRSIFYNPDVVRARLQGRPDPASKQNITIQQAVYFMPPRVTIQSPVNFSTTNTATTNLSVAIVDQNQPIKNIKILVNGRLLGSSELSKLRGTPGLQLQKASLTVTGNLRNINFTMPLDLDPGPNIIEVIAFNGYSESPRVPVEVTWNAPAGQRPALPNLWILAVGVNNYQSSSGQTNLSFCVADAKGVVSALKAQEGRRYAKVNSLLIADGEALAPTVDNIKKNLGFLNQAGERDVVLLFLAGHGVSDNAGKFYYLPTDTRWNANRTIDEASVITDADIIKVLDRAGNLLVFIDACNSGGVDSDRLVRSLMDTNAFVFTASKGTEFSFEDPELGHGFFSYSVMEGLKGAVAAQAQGNVTVLSLSGFVSQEVPRRTNGRQNPKAYSLGFYDYPMAVVNK